MLQARTKEQNEHIEGIVKKYVDVNTQNSKFVSADVYKNFEELVEINLRCEDCDELLSIDIRFDMMAEIVDYLRKENEQIETPTRCEVSFSDGILSYGLLHTPHEEVMNFCKKLAWVKGNDFDYYYKQYVKTRKITIRMREK